MEHPSDLILTTLKTSGWVVEARDDESVTITKTGRAELVMVYEPGMTHEVILEYATTRALEADVEDACRAVAPDATIRDILDAIWSAPAPATDSPALIALRTVLARDRGVAALRQRRDQHVAHSQARQLTRAQARFDTITEG